ncbi:MAG: Fic family protein [Gammaproteobacteria bacterium]|nr:Fic family protein [Gammaproteobacteria bacterium]MDE0368240.1 Fic family protein [Gammaproteobacteria bacterium]
MIPSADSPLGFTHSRCIFTTSTVPNVRRACFRVRKVLEEVVYDTVYLENNPFTFPEVKTLMDGITVGGHRLSDANQVLNQAASWRELLSQVEASRFVLDAANVKRLHTLVAREEALTWGEFRNDRVSVAGTDYQPPAHAELDAVFQRGLRTLSSIADVHERSIATFLFGALNQFFFDGNKRTARLLMNGQLLQAGYDAITIPARRKEEFNRTMIGFYDSRDGTAMFAFLADCSTDPNLKYRSNL